MSGILENQPETGNKSVRKVPFGMDFLGGLAEKHSRLLFRLADMETRAVAEEPDWLRSIDKPIYVSGLARAGTTILLELLASHNATASHCYRDFPFAAIPVMWNWFLDRAIPADIEPTERAHKDRIQVTPNSPEAMEEPLWMHFFPGCHDPEQSNILDARTSNPAFEAFYRSHIGKMLYLRHGSRYLAKGNYNVTRLEYLLKMFPDARFVIPVRDPVHHVASLMKQHALFCRDETEDPCVLNYMRRAGHFEFGLDRRPINTGDSERTDLVRRLWQDGEEVRGWALYWADIHQYVAGALSRSPALRAATLVVSYETLCSSPAAMLKKIYEHCDLAVDGSVIDQQAATLSVPDYYTMSLTESDQKIISDETADVVDAIQKCVAALTKP